MELRQSSPTNQAEKMFPAPKVIFLAKAKKPMPQGAWNMTKWGHGSIHRQQPEPLKGRFQKTGNRELSSTFGEHRLMPLRVAIPGAWSLLSRWGRSRGTKGEPGDGREMIFFNRARTRIINSWSTPNEGGTDLLGDGNRAEGRL